MIRVWGYRVPLKGVNTGYYTRVSEGSFKRGFVTRDAINVTTRVLKHNNSLDTVTKIIFGA